LTPDLPISIEVGRRVKRVLTPNLARGARFLDPVPKTAVAKPHGQRRHFPPMPICELEKATESRWKGRRDPPVRSHFPRKAVYVVDITTDSTEESRRQILNRDFPWFSKLKDYFSSQEKETENEHYQ